MNANAAGLSIEEIYFAALEYDDSGARNQGADASIADGSIAEKSIPDKSTADLMTDLAAAHIRAGRLDLALSCAQTALDASSARDDAYGEAEACVQIGRVHWHARRPAESIAAYERAITRYEQIGDRGRAAAAADHLGITLFEQGRYEDAFARG